MSEHAASKKAHVLVTELHDTYTVYFFESAETIARPNYKAMCEGMALC